MPVLPHWLPYDETTGQSESQIRLLDNTAKKFTYRHTETHRSIPRAMKHNRSIYPHRSIGGSPAGRMNQRYLDAVNEGSKEEDKQLHSGHALVEELGAGVLILLQGPATAWRS